MARRRLRQATARRLGIHENAQNCLYLDRFSPTSTIIDVGCADDADFSRFMIEAYGLRSFGVDPTRKHASALRALEASLEGNFQYVPLAVSDTVGQITFSESVHHVSGSLCPSHRNLASGDSVSYPVDSVTLGELLRRLGLERADYLKL
ncbi:MAG: hypothetical protein KDD44_13895, partial [Bdellovibrionales bacterium]|nr:hypothetical protein [Bdellovibrionales bacterium]